MNSLSSQLDSSLMDRFIALHLNNSDSELVRYVKYGLHPTNNAVLLNKRTSWFERNALSDCDNRCVLPCDNGMGTAQYP